ncbi:MAG: hypothetical protein ACK5Y2_07520 [Bdellovibrionales bacterium]
MKLQNTKNLSSKNSSNVIPLIKNLPKKYKDCPPDLMWAIDLDMNQDTESFQSWIQPIKMNADASTKSWAREKQKSQYAYALDWS